MIFSGTTLTKQWFNTKGFKGNYNGIYSLVIVPMQSIPSLPRSALNPLHPWGPAQISRGCALQ